MPVFTVLLRAPIRLEWARRRRIGLHSFACETETVWTAGAHHTKLMKTILASLPSKFGLSSAAESRIVFWNLLFTMLLSSLLLLVYLKKILFDF